LLKAFAFKKRGMTIHLAYSPWHCYLKTVKILIMIIRN